MMLYSGEYNSTSYAQLSIPAKLTIISKTIIIIIIIIIMITISTTITYAISIMANVSLMQVPYDYDLKLLSTGLSVSDGSEVWVSHSLHCC